MRCPLHAGYQCCSSSQHCPAASFPVHFEGRRLSPWPSIILSTPSRHCPAGVRDEQRGAPQSPGARQPASMDWQPRLHAGVMG